MDIRFDDNAIAFQQTIRGWLEDNVPKEPMPKDPDAAFQYRRAGSAKCTTPAGRASTGRRNTAGAARR